MAHKTVFKHDVAEGDAEIVVEKWDMNAVRNALDDAIRKFFSLQSGFRESHCLMNGRLVISTIAIMFSIYAILYDWYHPFPESRSTLICCVIAYFIIISILTIYTTFIERGIFATFKQADESGKNKANIWKIKNLQHGKTDDAYTIEIELTDGSSKKTTKKTNEASVAQYFDEDGRLAASSLYRDLSKTCSSMLEKKSN